MIAKQVSGSISVDESQSIHSGLSGLEDWMGQISADNQKPVLRVWWWGTVLPELTWGEEAFQRKFKDNIHSSLSSSRVKWAAERKWETFINPIMKRGSLRTSKEGNQPFTTAGKNTIDRTLYYRWAFTRFPSKILMEEVPLRPLGSSNKLVTYNVQPHCM